MKPVTLLALLSALSACATVPNTRYPVRADGLATFGQTTQVGLLVATPLSLIEDSRCPINARCIWAGRLVLRTQIAGAGWRETVDLTLGQLHLTHGTGLTLVSAEPGKMAGLHPSPSAGLFGFELR